MSEKAKFDFWIYFENGHLFSSDIALNSYKCDTNYGIRKIKKTGHKFKKVQKSHPQK